MKAHSELELIARRYRKYGVTLDKLLDLLASAEARGLPHSGALAWLRLTLGSMFGEEEYFNAEQIAAMTGETPEQATARMMEFCRTHPDHGPVITIDRRTLAMMQEGQEEQP